MSLTPPPSPPPTPPTAPARSQGKVVFGINAQAFAAWWVGLGTWLIDHITWLGTNKTELDALQADVSTKQGVASTAATNAGISAAAASGSANAAAASALTAVNAPGTAGTSATSTALTTGTKSITTQAGKSWTAGQVINFARTSAPTTSKAIATIASYDFATGAMTFDIAAASDITGSGTFTDWTISLGGGTGPAGAAGAAGSVSRGRKNITAADYLGGPGSSGSYANNLGQIVRVSGLSADITVAIDSAANCGANWFLSFYNDDPQYKVTLTAASIDGATSKVVRPGDGIEIQGNGTDFQTEQLRGNPLFGAVGSANVIDTNNSADTIAMCALSSTLAILFHKGTNGYPRASLLDNTGAKVGSTTLVQNGKAVQSGAICRLDATHAIATWRNNTDTQLEAVLLTISGGNTISVGTICTVMVANISNGECSITALSSSKAMVSYCDTSNNRLSAQLLTVSGTTLSNSGAYNPSTGTTPSTVRVAALTSTQAIASMTSAAYGTQYAVGFPLTDTGSAITFPSPITMSAHGGTGGTGRGDIIALSATRALSVAGYDIASNGQGFAYTVDLTGTGSSARLQMGRMLALQASGSYACRLAKVSATAAVRAVETFDLGSLNLEAILINGDALELGASVAIARSVDKYDVCVLDANTALVAYSDRVNSNYPTVKAVALGTVK